MTEKELKEFIQNNYPKENSKIEHKNFSTLKQNISGRKSEDVISYISWFSNVEWGFLIIWVMDITLDIEGIIEFDWYTIENIKERILWNIVNLDSERFNVKEYKTTDTNKIVWIFEIPQHNPRKITIAHNTKYQRIWDSLHKLTQEKENEILNESTDMVDRSWLPCEGTTIDDLDKNMLELLKNKILNKTKNEEYKSYNIIELLNKCGLLENWIPNNTCILFLWKEEIAIKKLPWISSYIRKYEDEKNKIEDRIDDSNSPLLQTIYSIIDKILKYNFPIEDIASIFRVNMEYQYSKEAIEELVTNSLAHRDWLIKTPNRIHQTPNSLIFTNPWKFNNDLDSVLFYSRNTPYKNQVMADFLKKIWLMEQERWWLQKVYKSQLSKWLYVKKEEGNGDVRIILDWRIKNSEFARLVIKHTDIERNNLFLLFKISEWRNLIWLDLLLEDSEKLKQLWYIEYQWKNPNKKAIISYDIMKEIWKKSEYIYKKWIWTKKQELLILQFLEKNKTISTEDSYRLFPEINKNSIKRLLADMHKRKKIQRSWRWIYKLILN